MAITGSSGSDELPGTDGPDEILGYDPAIGDGGLSIQVTRIATGLDRPTYVTSAPNDPGRLYIVEKEGLIKVMDRDSGEISATPVLDVRGQIDIDGEQGLLGLAFHPRFGEDGFNKVYVTLSNPDGQTELREYSLTDGVLEPVRLVLRITEYTEQSPLHRGGWIGFGSDGSLYMTTGDGNQFAVAQDPESLLGKVLRIDVDSEVDAYPEDPEKNFAIPDTNPTQFDGVSGTFQPSEVYAIGFRNPWRASIDSQGRMFIGDVGEREYEEINLLVPGANYGWGHGNDVNGNDDGEDDGPEVSGPYTNPINYYYHGADPNIPDNDVGGSVTGGYVYEGPITALNGHYIFSDYISGKILSLHQDENGDWHRTDLTSLLTGDATGSLGKISSFGQDSDGNIYVVAYAEDGASKTGKVYRLTPQIYDEGDILYGLSGNDTIHGGGGNDTLYGGDDDDYLYGDSDNDEIYGEAGNDTLSGGAGDDIYYVDAHDRIIEALNDGRDEVRALESFTLQAGQAVEVLRAADEALGTNAALTGNALSQVLVGNEDANILNGGGGVDTLRGGMADDTYVVDGDDIIEEARNAGFDTVETTANRTLESNVENLTLLEGASTGTGNALNNVIVGNAADNTLDGGAGSDFLTGGDGNDTYLVNTQADSIRESANEGTDTLIASASYVLFNHVQVEILKAASGAGAVDLTGNSLANTLHGNGAANRLDGGGGSDTVVFTGNRADYTVTKNENGSIAVADKRASGDGVDTILNVEIFQFADRKMDVAGLLNTAPSGLSLEGNVVDENSKKDKVIGTVKVVDDAGDTHRFELANDAGGRFAIDATTGVIKVADGIRLDREQAEDHMIEVVATDAAGESVRKTFKIIVADVLNETATGSDLADVMKGGSGADSFNGAAGNDYLESADGHDTLTGGDGGDTLDAGTGNDRLYGESGDDLLQGGSGNDMLSAGTGNDRLSGGSGKDTLTGGTGWDMFIFDDRETGSSKTKADYITDFKGREGDRLDLKLVDANTKKSGDQKFTFIGTKAFSKAGEVRYEKTKKDTYVYLNTDSDKAAEAVIKLKGSFDLQKGWFVL